MKKNVMMRVASVLLIAVLMSTCVISGTFAKYTTSDTGSDSARVAKWGVTIDVTVDGAFATEYVADATQNDANGTTIAKTVVNGTNDEKNLVAPGTKGYLLKEAAISGTPEVAVNVKKEANLTLTGWEIDGAYYCPITIIVDNNTTLFGQNYDSASEFEEAVENALNSDINYAPNKNLAETHTVTWEWAFDSADTTKQTDAKDTAIGDLTTAPTIAFDLTITVTQIN